MDDSYLQILNDMEEGERKLFLQNDDVVNSKRWLEQMLATNQQLEDHAKHFYKLAQQSVMDYQMFKGDPGSEKLLERAEFYKDLALNLASSKYSIKDIRKQREQIQWEVRRMNSLEKTIGSKPSSET